MNKSLFYIFIVIFIAIGVLFGVGNAQLQNQAPIQIQETGKLPPEAVQLKEKILEQKDIGPQQQEALKEIKEKILEQKQKEVQQDTKKIPQEEKKQKVPEKVEEPKKAEEAIEEPIKVEEPIKKEEEDFVAEEDFFKKIKLPGRSTLEIFGHNLFSSPPETFQPILAVPVSEDYVIGPGDEIIVNMWGRLEEQYKLIVDNEGIIVFPKIGPMMIAGLTFKEVKEVIRQKAESITGVYVSVSMGRLKTMQVFVLGEVQKPGVYTVSSLATIANVLLVCGGVTPLGSMRRIELKRKDVVVTTIDLYDLLMKGDISSDIRLTNGDVIFVPQTGPMISVSGNVKRPAIYELKYEKSLQEVLNLAGGLSPSAYNQRIQIERFHENQVMIVLDITDSELKSRKDTQLKDGDLVRVFSILPLSVNSVYLYGNVLRPGQYAFKPGLKIKDLIPDIQSLKLDTFFDYGVIRRYRLNDMKSEIIPFNIGNLLLKNDESQNLHLMPGDEIYVFDKYLFQDKRFAEVKGFVRKPGRYYIDDMTIKDLIRKAGDLKEDANLQKGELVRTDEKRQKHTIYFDVAAAMNEDPKHNLKVQHEDVIIIHSIWETYWQPVVNIKGEIKKPGEFVISKDMRIQDLIFKAGGFTRDAYMEIGHLHRTDMLTRDITILTFNVQEAMNGNPEHNLLLEDLDQVVIHSIWEYITPFKVSIVGLVNKPGEYPYAVNMTIKDLIFIAGNVKKAAFLDEAELTRYSIIDGKQVQTSIYSFNVNLAQQGHPEHNLKLEPMDVVTIKAIPDWWDKKKSVTITGEVYFPGEYQIRKDERLSDIIERAGGFTEYAYMQGAVFTRESAKKIQHQRITELMENLELEIHRASSQEIQAALSEADVAAQSRFVNAQKALLEKLKKTKPTGRVIVKIGPVESMKGTGMDILLEDGDTLHIPMKPHTVNVLGAVYNSTSLLYDEKNTELQHYLNMTGGPTDNAEISQMYIVRVNGVVESRKTASSWWRKFESTPLQPGDTVLVPEKVIRPSFLKDVKDITEILYQIAVTAGITITQVF